MKLNELFESKRPMLLGDAFFYYNGQLIDVGEHRNHKDWLVAHINDLGLPEYVLDKPSKALFEAYKKGWIRIVWDEGGKWKQGSARGEGNVLYLNGIDKIVWQNMKRIMNEDLWSGRIDTVVIEYLDIVNDKPKWNRSDIYRQSQIGWKGMEDLYRGRKPKRSLVPTHAIDVNESEIKKGIIDTYGVDARLSSILKERKQVGTLYHFTDLYGAFGILEDMKIKKNEEADDISAHGGVFVMTAPRQGISFTRNSNLIATRNAGSAKERPWGEVRIAIDGDRLSDRYKIEPYVDKDNSITRADDQAEEVVRKNEVDISGLILEVVFNYNLYIQNKQDYDSWASPPDDEETRVKYLNMDRRDASLFIKTLRQKGIPYKVKGFKKTKREMT